MKIDEPLDIPDTVTGLIRQGEALRQLADWQNGAARWNEKASIHCMSIGLKRFSAVNLAYGREAGDRALVELTNRVLQFARGELEGENAQSAGNAHIAGNHSNWLLSRLDNGAFLLAANHACSRERWQWLAEELSQAIAQPIATLANSAELRLWPRVALLRATPADNPAGIISRLEEAQDKNRHQSGRRLFWVDGEASLPGRSARQLEADLISALDRDEIDIVYQPQFSTQTGRVVGVEALARWRHPELGRIGAVALFAIAERADHVGQLSRHIFNQALNGFEDWAGGLRLSLNVAPADLSSRFFPDMVAEALSASGFPPEKLTLEITEQALLSDLDTSAERLGQLSELGIAIALDDFGAGFCNFRYLKILSPDYLKLDRSMVEGIANDPRDLAILRGIIAMAKALDLDVIAEGVETEAQRRVIVEEGCVSWQGFLGAEPLSREKVTALLQKNGAGTLAASPQESPAHPHSSSGRRS